jgi:hypothetical protein
LTTRIMLAFAVIGVLITVPLGFAAVAEYGLDHLVSYHERVALGASALLFLTWAVREAVEWGFLSGRWLYGQRIFLLVACLMVAWAGFLGGEMVHGVGHLAWPH